MKTSSVRVSIGRVLQIRFPKNPRAQAAIATSGPIDENGVGIDPAAPDDGDQFVDANVFANGFTDPEIVGLFRMSPTGNTVRVRLYDALTHADRTALDDAGQHWAEWPPR